MSEDNISKYGLNGYSRREIEEWQNYLEALIRTGNFERYLRRLEEMGFLPKTGLPEDEEAVRYSF